MLSGIRGTHPDGLTPGETRAHRYFITVVKGKMAMFLALFMAVVISLWCLAQLPDILRGMIFPLSVMKCLKILGFL